MRLILFFLPILFSSLFSQSSSTNYVVLRNGEKLFGSIRFVNNELGFGTTLFVDDTTKLSYFDVDSIIYNTNVFVFHQLVHIEKNKASKYEYILLKRTVNGAISVFTSIYNYSELQKKANYEYFSTENSELSKVNYSNLSEILSQDENSAVYLRRSRKYGSWSKKILIVGAGTFLYGLMRTKFNSKEFNNRTKEFEFKTKYNPGVFVGLTLALGSRIVFEQSHRNLVKAIDSFNGNFK